MHTKFKYENIKGKKFGRQVYINVRVFFECNWLRICSSGGFL
jgi:hypothetical protein